MERIVNRKYLVAAFVLLSVFLMAGMSVAAVAPAAPISDGSGGSGGTGLYMWWWCTDGAGHLTNDGGPCDGPSGCLRHCLSKCGRSDSCEWGTASNGVC